jgi:hypothetical protein
VQHRSGLFLEGGYEFVPHPSLFGNDVALSSWMLGGGIRFGFGGGRSSHPVSATAPVSSAPVNGEPSKSAEPSKVAEPAKTATAAISMLATPSNKQWLDPAINQFNKDNKGVYSAQTSYLSSREAMHAILAGRDKPVLWAPDNTIWVTRLAEVYKGNAADQPITNTNDSQSFHVFQTTPLVFVTTKDKAAFLQPLLSSQDAWQNIIDLGSGTKQAPWGAFHLAHGNPVRSNAGFLTLGLMLSDYARRNGKDVSVATAQEAGFVEYLKQVDKSLVLDKSGGASYDLAQAFDVNHSDVIVTYESNAIVAAIKNPNLVVIYPDPNFAAERVVTVVNGQWTTAEQRAGAQKFISLLSDMTARADQARTYYRSAGAGSTPEFNALLTRLGTQGFVLSPKTAPLPDYLALNEAARTWWKQIAQEPGEMEIP